MKKEALIHFLLIVAGVGLLVWFIKNRNAATAGAVQVQPGTSQSGVPQYDPNTQTYSVAPLQPQPSAANADPASIYVAGNNYGAPGGNKFTFGGSPQYFDFSKPFTYNQAPIVPNDGVTRASDNSGSCCDPCGCEGGNAPFSDGGGATQLAPSRRQQLLNTQNKNGGAKLTWADWAANLTDALPTDPSSIFMAQSGIDNGIADGTVPAGSTNAYLS